MTISLRPKELKEKVDSREWHSPVIIVDIRDISEYEHEHIPGALHIPLSNLAACNGREYSDKIGVFYCSSGIRTKVNAAVLECTPFREKYYLEGGISAWKRCGFPSDKNGSLPLDVMRQTQLLIGLLLVAAVGLGGFVSPYFFLLPLLAGIGLIVAGATGFCGMAMVLSLAPWNKKKA